MRYEDWTFRAAEVRWPHTLSRDKPGTANCARLQHIVSFYAASAEQVIAQVLAEVVRRFQSRKAPRQSQKHRGGRCYGLAPGAISTFFVRRREQHGGAAIPYHYHLKWLLAV